MSDYYSLPQPAPYADQPPFSKPAPSRARKIAVTAGLVGAGLAAGAVIATTIGAGAQTTGSGTGSGPAAFGAPGYGYGAGPSGAAGALGTDRGHGPGGGDRQPWTTGTVTAVGSDSVTIKTSSATTTYGVTSSSDIDKNGEAKLSDLKAGDAVRFTTTTTSGKTVIDKLHAGDEALNRPTR